MGARRICCGAAAWLAENFGPGYAVAILLFFDGYLHPYEGMAVRLCDIYFPTPEFPCLSVQICPWSMQRPSKTGVFDDTVVLDRPDCAFLGDFVAALRRGLRARPLGRGEDDPSVQT